MRLATLNDGSRDGSLVVVSADNRRYTPAGGIAGTMQEAFERWQEAEPQLRALAVRLDIGQIEGRPLVAANCLAPLPRAYQWAEASVYTRHLELMHGGRGEDMPASFWVDPLISEGASSRFLAPREPIMLPEEALELDGGFGLDFEASLAVITDDVPMGVSASEALRHIKLIALVNCITLRHLVPSEIAKGFGFFKSKPAASFAPIAVTPDEFGRQWQGGKLAGRLLVTINTRRFGDLNPALDMAFDYGQIIAHAACTRRLPAGSLISAGAVSNGDPARGPGRPISWGGNGYACIAEMRMMETVDYGHPDTRFLTGGDVVHIEMVDAHGQSCFGAIEQEVKRI
ncbi:fumarylacetoacetate hydrolase family protein [Afifella sp. JA880]|uniref:fumarylacetoacetate hydrolase family protein n=1 Tax=Afifella sp. JA880 TaxID=2975280 RepID=UPI0021BB3680|nr:fumarylacetoacetate hydrolase family protein [Afifella sp. JA880]MCT8266571.1 fumarylacetoacetate hydrolase family protein [Afifella sp. JA880]